MDYYDFVLGIIPLSLAGIAGGLIALGVQTVVAIPLAAIVSLGIMAHAIFVRAPIEPTGSATDARQADEHPGGFSRSTSSD